MKPVSVLGQKAFRINSSAAQSEEDEEPQGLVHEAFGFRLCWVPVRSGETGILDLPVDVQELTCGESRRRVVKESGTRTLLEKLDPSCGGVMDRFQLRLWDLPGRRCVQVCPGRGLMQRVTSGDIQIHPPSCKEHDFMISVIFTQ